MEHLTPVFVLPRRQPEKSSRLTVTRSDERSAEYDSTNQVFVEDQLLSLPLGERLRCSLRAEYEGGECQIWERVIPVLDLIDPSHDSIALAIVRRRAQDSVPQRG